MFDHFKLKRILGVDVHANLIDRAQQNAVGNDCIEFRHCDIIENPTIIDEYLQTLEPPKSKFDVIFCFSVTMWIHLNYEDGLKHLFSNCKRLCKGLLVLEPQPWKW